MTMRDSGHQRPELRDFPPSMSQNEVPSSPWLTAAFDSPPDERETLLRTARSRQTPHGVATRAQLVVDSADLGVAEAARRASVSRATAAKWRRRYLDAGDRGPPRRPTDGRPPDPDDVVRRILGCALDEPPAGTERWTHPRPSPPRRASARPPSAGRGAATSPGTGPRRFLSDRTSILSYVGVLPAGCVLGFQPATGARATRRRPGPGRRRRDHPLRGDAAQAGRGTTADGHAPVSAGPPTDLPSTPAVTLVLDTALDAPARTGSAVTPRSRCTAVTGAGWLGLLHRIA